VREQPKFDHLVIHISDWDRANAFYKDVLGGELVDCGGGTWPTGSGQSN
jgi:catechol 2,3-dioxygenase-like lactoylglutathione lyase family enzyme